MKVNHVIKTMIVGDFYLNAGFSIFAPFFAVFVTGQIENATIQTVGFGAAIAQITKCIFQIPIAKYLDKNHGEHDDYISLVTGNFLGASVPFLYLMATQVNHIYIIQAIYGLALAMLVPPWNAIFSRHLDKMQEAVEWSFESVGIGLATAGAAAIGGVIANNFGFKTVFLVGGLLALIGAAEQAKIFSDLKDKVKQGTVKPDPKGV
jgi:MFS family permease